MQPSTYIPTWRRLAVEQRSSAIKRTQGKRIHSTPKSSRRTTESELRRGRNGLHIMQRPENRPHIIRAAFLFLLVSESQQQAPQVHYNRSWPGVERNGKQMRVQNCGRSVSNSDGHCVRFTRQVWRLRKSIGNLRL